MGANSQFAVAVHSLALMELFPSYDGRRCLTSGEIAESVNTNPVVIRRVMGHLRERGLVHSQPGPGGGWKLNRPSDQINLRDVFQSVQEESLFALPRQEPSAECPVGVCLPSVLVSCFHEAEEAMLNRLAQVSIADVVESVKSEFSCDWEADHPSEGWPGLSQHEGAMAAHDVSLAGSAPGGD